MGGTLGTDASVGPRRNDSLQLFPSLSVPLAMLRHRVPLLSLLLFTASLSVFAQARGPYRPEAAPGPGWTPHSLDGLARNATFHTNFTFNRAMLRFANNFIDNGDADTRSAVNKLDAISVYSYHFSSPARYDEGALARVRADYGATGWTHLTTAHSHGDPFTSGQTDIWISFSHAQVTGMAVLITGAKDINLITLTGNLSPLDLLHLRGHFGIPRFDASGLPPDIAPPENLNNQPANGDPAAQSPNR